MTETRVYSTTCRENANEQFLFYRSKANLTIIYNSFQRSTSQLGTVHESMKIFSHRKILTKKMSVHRAEDSLRDFEKKAAHTDSRTGCIMRDTLSGIFNVHRFVRSIRFTRA